MLLQLMDSTREVKDSRVTEVYFCFVMDVFSRMEMVDAFVMKEFQRS